MYFAGILNEKFKEKQNKTKLRWAYRYLRRNGFSIRRISHLGQFVPRDNNNIKSKFIADIIKARKELNIPYNEDCRIINMDETPRFLDMYFDTTIDFVGNRHVEIESMGKEKYRISVILGITDDG